MSPRRPKSRTVMALAACLMVTAAACSSSSKPSAGGTTTTTGAGVTAPSVINIGYVADMQVPDPDVFYQIEGNSVVTSVYEGLVAYADNSTKIIPALATSWTISPDGLTYTFNLRPNVMFHDGTMMTSHDAEVSFMRRTALGSTVSAPAYMLADVAGYATPSPLVFVITLKVPVAPFMDYMAAPYGPKISSSTALAAHAGTDMDQTWLDTHDAGTGPFTITNFIPGQQYTLTAFPSYWGGAPKVSEIHISIIPDITTQQEELQSGQLQMIIHGLNKQDIQSYENNPKYQVQRFPANFKDMMMVNENKGPFTSQALRSALQQDVNKSEIVSDVYGNDASISNQIYPAGELPVGMASDTPTYDPSVLAGLVKGLSDKNVDIAYTSDDARNQQVAEIIQTELQTAGMNATVRAMPIAVAFNLPTDPKDAPDLLVSTLNPDDSAPDGWVRIFMHTFDGTNGTLNWLLCSDKSADAAMDKGQNLTDPTAIQAAYAQSGDDLYQSGCFVTIADVKDVVVADAGYSNWMHQLPTVFSVEFGKLTLHS
jgi:peptide/nickel transport system substrate-binding protein